MRFFALACLFILAVPIMANTNVGANPIPMPDSDGAPVPADHHLDILFRSEKVVYTIDNEQQARVSALYVLQNSANATVVQNISLPFYYTMPKDLKLGSNDRPVPFEKSEYLSYENMDYAYARFPLDFAACETLTLKATYSIKYTAYSDHPHMTSLELGKVYYKHFDCRYNAETGVYWHNPLESAVFQFRVKKDLYGSGLEGFDKTEEGGYVVATKTYTGWRPNESIWATWEQPDIAWTVVGQTPLILVIVLISMAAYIVVRVRRRRRKAKNVVPVK